MQVRELNTEIVNNAAKVHTALKLSQEDQNTIATLRKEIEKAWKMVDVAREKEVRAKETINQLKDEIANLSKLVEKGAKLSGGQESMVKELLVTRDELTRQADEQQQQTKQLEAQLYELHRQKEELEENHAAVKAKGESLEENLAARHAEVQREQRRRERLDRELRETRGKLDKKTVEQEAMGSEVVTAQAQISQLEKQLTEARATMEKYLRDYDTLYQVILLFWSLRVARGSSSKKASASSGRAGGGSKARERHRSGCLASATLGDSRCCRCPHARGGGGRNEVVGEYESASDEADHPATASPAPDCSCS
jgi:chromosome segregation ATPase